MSPGPVSEAIDRQVAMQLHAAAVLKASGWFQQGLMMLERLREANFVDDELCWYIPTGVLGHEVMLKGATLLGLPVHEATSSCPPGIGIPLPVCTRGRDCKAHTEPPRQAEQLWLQWAKLHGVPTE